MRRLLQVQFFVKLMACASLLPLLVSGGQWNKANGDEISLSGQDIHNLDPDDDDSAEQTSPSKLDGRTLLENVLLNLKLVTSTFESDWDPRKPNSSWMFRFLPPSFRLDHGAFLVDKSDKHAPVTLVTLPFTKYYPPSDGPIAGTTQETAMSPRYDFNVTVTQKILVRLLFSCTTYNADRNPFPPELVKKSWDDPRLGSCFVSLGDPPNTGVKFTFMATSKAVWASYARDPLARGIQNQTWQAFDVWRRLAVRKSNTGVIDVSILYDRAKGCADYFVNGANVWTVKNFGQLPDPADGRNRIVALTDGADQLVSPGMFTAFFGTQGPIDRYDPNNNAPPADQTALIRLVGTSGHYGNMSFWDNASLPTNKNFGQGVAMKLKKIEISLAESSSSSQSNGDESDWSDNGEEADINLESHGK